MNFITALFILLSTGTSLASLSRVQLPKAKDVTWSSFNFKTILTWGPKPSNYTYTVEFSRVGKNRRRNLHCIQTVETECDLTNDLQDLKGFYIAEVLSEGVSHYDSNPVELPFTQSKKFCPYSDTLIGKPEFSIKLTENKTVVIYIQDQVTALQKDGKALTIRDVFKGDLKYKIEYNKAGSTGKKDKVVDGNEVEMSELDEGQSYCFSVAAYLPLRKGVKKLGKWSLPQCSSSERSLIEEYGLWVVGSGLVVLVTLVVMVVILMVACCRRTRKGKQAEDSEVITTV